MDAFFDSCNSLQLNENAIQVKSISQKGGRSCFFSHPIMLLKGIKGQSAGLKRTQIQYTLNVVMQCVW